MAEVVDENMANAARAHAVENGKDMGGYTMIAFGGGAPLHAARLMDKLGLDELIVPPGAGVGSAIGFLVAPFSYEAVRSFYTSTLDFDVEGSNEVLASLTDEAMSFVQPALSEDAEATLTVERQVSMRYAGQGWEIPVALDDDSSFDEFAAELLSAKFTKAYEEFFGRAIDDLAIETVSWSVRVSSIVLAGERVELSIASSSAVAPGCLPRCLRRRLRRASGNCGGRPERVVARKPSTRAGDHCRGADHHRACFPPRLHGAG